MSGEATRMTCRDPPITAVKGGVGEALLALPLPPEKGVGGGWVTLRAKSSRALAEALQLKATAGSLHTEVSLAVGEEV